MSTIGGHPYLPARQTCPDCHRVYYSWGAHLEECAGPPQRIAPASPPDPGSKCGCNNGGMHQPDCVHVTGKEAA